MGKTWTADACGAVCDELKGATSQSLAWGAS